MKKSGPTPVGEYARFWPKVEQDGPHGCWIWRANKNPAGYGTFTCGTIHEKTLKTVNAHRYAYEQANGPVPDGLVVRHTCDNPSCVNPLHLVAGTQSDNVQDMVRRNRAAYVSHPGERNGRAMLTGRDVRWLRLNKPGPTEAKKRFGIGSSQYYRVINGIAWKCCEKPGSEIEIKPPKGWCNG